MEKFENIYQRAVERKGGEKSLKSLLPKKTTKKTFLSYKDSDFLSAMTKKIFQSGFIWRVVENKWSGFEEVFWGFAPEKLQLASDEQIEKMAQDKRIIRNFIKVKSVRDNAYFVKEISDKYGCFAKFIYDWPENEITKLWLFLKKNGSRLGGNTGPYVLREMGKDTFIFSNDTVSYFINQRVIERHPSSQRDLKIVQGIFNDWQQQSGLSLAEISKIVACSFGENKIDV